MFNRGRLNIWLLGITIVIGGQYVGWNAEMNRGLFLNLLCFGCVSIACSALCCCTAEISGALPFAGGTYGLARCTLGFFPAFLIDCYESLEYIAYVAASVMILTELVIEDIPSLEHFDPLHCLLLYLSVLVFLRRGRVFWSFNALLAGRAHWHFACVLRWIASFVDLDKFARQQNLVSMVTWLRVFIALAFFQTKHDFATFVGVMAARALYCFLYAKHR